MNPARARDPHPAPAASAAPIGPSVERWRAMSEPEKDRFYQQIDDALRTLRASLKSARAWP